MNTEVVIIYDTNKPSKDISSYLITYSDTHDALHGLRASPPEVWNNIIGYRGVYATRQEAEAAAQRYTGMQTTEYVDDNTRSKRVTGGIA